MVNEATSGECVVLLTTGHVREPGCGESLKALAQRGYPVWRQRGSAALDVARSQLASDALAAGFKELLWIDADVGFHPDEVERLRSHPHLFIGALCPHTEQRRLACTFLPGTREVRFGEHGGLLQVRYAALNFVLIRRALFEEMRQRLKLPVCNERTGRPLVPWFAPMVHDEGEARSYLGADFAFCERARRVGMPILIDTRISLWHLGEGAEAGSSDDRGAVATATTADPPVRNVLHGPAKPLASSFPRLRAYVFSYPANGESLRLTLEDFGRSDWREEPLVFMQPDDWPAGRPSASRNYRRVLEHAYEDGCDFALILEDDVRVNRWLRHNLASNPLVRRDQCDFLSLYMPDLIASPWLRRERHLGYRLARPLYSGPNHMWERSRIWGSQGYVLSRRFLRAALDRWDRLGDPQDTRIISVCSELGLPLWYTDPCLLEHAPLTTAFATPAAHAPDFDREFRLEPAPGFQPPEALPGLLSEEEGLLLWRQAAGRRVLELGTAAGRSTVCLAQQAGRVVTVDALDQSEAKEWGRRYEVDDRIVFHQGEVSQVVAGLAERFDMILVAGEHHAPGLQRDIEAALSVMEPGGLLAFHGYPDPQWPDVRRLVDEHARRLGWRRIAQIDFLGVFRTPDPAQSTVTPSEI